MPDLLLKLAHLGFEASDFFSSTRFSNLPIKRLGF